MGLASALPEDAALRVRVTLDDVGDVTGDVASIRQIAKTPTVRIVFDAGQRASDYTDAISKLHSSAYIMGELIDSSSIG